MPIKRHKFLFIFTISISPFFYLKLLINENSTSIK